MTTWSENTKVTFQRRGLAEQTASCKWVIVSQWFIRFYVLLSWSALTDYLASHITVTSYRKHMWLNSGSYSSTVSSYHIIHHTSKNHRHCQDGDMLTSLKSPWFSGSSPEQIHHITGQTKPICVNKWHNLKVNKTWRFVTCSLRGGVAPCLWIRICLALEVLFSFRKWIIWMWHSIQSMFSFLQWNCAWTKTDTKLALACYVYVINRLLIGMLRVGKKSENVVIRHN